MEERRRYIYAFCMLSPMNHLPEDKKVAGSQSETATYFKKGRIIAVGTSIDEEKVVIKDREITGISDPDSNGNVTITVDGDPFTTEVGYVIYHVGQKTGGCDDLGNASGSKDADDPTVPVSYRGIEDPWGNVWEFVDGMNILDEDRRTYITDDPKNFADNVFDGQYKAIGIPLPPTKPIGEILPIPMMRIGFWCLPKQAEKVLAPIPTFLIISMKSGAGGRMKR